MGLGDDEYEAACAHDRRGEEAEAIPHYRKALELGLDDADARGAMLGLGSSLRNVGEHAEAVRVLEAAVARFGDYPALRAFLALARHSAGLGALAVADLLELAIANADFDGYERALSYYADELRTPPSRRSAGLEQWPEGLGDLVLLGELHGNEAGPEALWALAEVTLEAGEPVTIGIEASERDNALFESFLAGDADREALLAGAFFGASWFDGRANVAMLRLFERARARRSAGDDVRLFGFLREGDHDPDDQNPHEQRMADALLEHVEPGRRLVALVGNLHAQRTSFQFGDAKEVQPMAARIAERTALDNVELVYGGTDLGRDGRRPHAAPSRAQRGQAARPSPARRPRVRVGLGSRRRGREPKGGELRAETRFAVGGLRWAPPRPARGQAPLTPTMLRSRKRGFFSLRHPRAARALTPFAAAQHQEREQGEPEG